MDLISVIVPIYNVEQYLDRCMESIVHQTYRNLEIILVDDGSQDRCPQMCDEWAEKESRIRVIHKKNSGPGNARNSGMEIMAGDYVMFVDSDDYLSQDAVQVLYERLIADGSDFVVGKHTDVCDDLPDNGSFCDWMEDAVMSKEDVLCRFAEAHYFPVGPVVKLYKRSLLEQITFPDLACGEDMWVFPEILDRCNAISVVNKTIYFYYQRENSAVHGKNEAAKVDALKATLKLSRYLWKNNNHSATHAWFRRCVNEAFTLKNKKTGMEMIESSFNPAERKTLLRGQSIKTHIKWWGLKSPALAAVIQFAKKMTGGGKV